MRLGGLILLLILSYFFNPIEPIVYDPAIIDLTEFESSTPIIHEDLDASLIDQDILQATV